MFVRCHRGSEVRYDKLLISFWKFLQNVCNDQSIAIDNRRWKSVANNWWLSIVIDWSTRFRTINRLSSIDHCIPGIYPSSAMDWLPKFVKNQTIPIAPTMRAVETPLMFQIFRNILIHPADPPTNLVHDIWRRPFSSEALISKLVEYFFEISKGKPGLSTRYQQTKIVFIFSWTFLQLIIKK